MSDPTPIDLSPEALERVKELAVRATFSGSAQEELAAIFDDPAFVLALIERMQKGPQITDEMVERGARGIARENASKIGHAWPDKFVEANWRNFTDYTRACLQAALTPATPEK